MQALDHPLANLILERRRLNGIARQANGLLKAICHDGRIHARFDPTGTDAGRFSSSKPNLQNINRGELRECFIAKPDHLLVCADYSQIELRVAAAIAGEQQMIDAFMRREDLHRQTAALILEKDPPLVNEEDRRLAKAVNFGLLYGQAAKGLKKYAKDAYNVVISDDEATRLRERFFSAYKGLANWHQACRNSAEDPACTETRTRMGRRRLLQPVSKENFWSRFTCGLNSPVQGGAADGMKLAMVALANTLPDGAFIVSTIHDEVIIECPEILADKVKQLVETTLSAEMAKLYREVPIEATAAVGKTWAKAK